MFSPSDAIGPDKVMIIPTLTVSVACATKPDKPSRAKPHKTIFESFTTIFVPIGRCCAVMREKSDRQGLTNESPVEGEIMRVYRGWFEPAAGEPMLLLEGDGRVDAELGTNAVLADPDIFMAACGRRHEKIARSFHAACQRIFDIERIANINVVVDDDDEVEIFQGAECRQHGIALEAVVLRRRLADLDDRMETMQAAGRHLDVGDDRDRALQNLEKRGFEDIFAQHDRFAAITVDGVIDRLVAMGNGGDFKNRRI